MAFLHAIRLNTRLALIGLLFAVPFSGLTVWLLVKGVNANIAFARQELRGNDVQRPLEDLLQVLGTAQLHASGISVRDAASLPAAINRAFDAVESAVAQHSDALQFTAEGLASRQRQHLAPAAVRKRLQGAGIGSSQALASAIADVRGMIAHAGDTSNLILDPDLDSYYVMDVTLGALPQTQERIPAILARFVPLIREGALDQATRQAIAVQAAFLREADLARIVASAQTAAKEDANFYAASATLQARLSAGVGAYERSVAKLADLLERGAAGEAISAESVATAGLEAHDASFALWKVAVDELDALLRARITAFSNERLQGLLGFGAAILLASLGSLLLARSISSQLNDVSKGLATGAEELSAAAREIISGSESLARGANEQAASVQQTSASIEELVGMTRQNAEHANEAKRLSQQTRSVAETGANEIQAMYVAMDGIKAASGNIAAIIQTIDEISFQTNILALNAAVEAARAGEAGAGFAVVADEVRALARRSANAARETSEKIADAIEKSKQGVDVSTRVATSLQEIVTKARQVDDLVGAITTASSEQTQGLAHIANAVTSIDSVTQATAANAQQSASGAQILNMQVEALDNAVRQLERLTDTERPHTAHEVPVPLVNPATSATTRSNPVPTNPKVARASRERTPVLQR